MKIYLIIIILLISTFSCSEMDQPTRKSVESTVFWQEENETGKPCLYYIITAKGQPWEVVPLYAKQAAYFAREKPDLTIVVFILNNKTDTKGTYTGFTLNQLDNIAKLPYKEASLKAMEHQWALGVVQQNK
jgi:hypothetical protein